MARKSGKKSFMELLSSPAVLVPIVLGVGGAIVVWAVRDKEQHIAAFLAIVGCLGAFGTLMTLLLFNTEKVDPAVARRRSDLLAGLEALASSDSRGACPEAELAATAAQAERI
jgi:hypothetical protein